MGMYSNVSMEYCMQELRNTRNTNPIHLTSSETFLRELEVEFQKLWIITTTKKNMHVNMLKNASAKHHFRRC